MPQKQKFSNQRNKKEAKIYPKLGVNRRIVISKQVLEKALEIEAAAMENTEVLEAVDHRLRVLHRGVLLLLDILHEPAQVLGVHDAVLGVLREELLDVGRRLGGGEAEAAAEAEAHSVGLLGHGIVQSSRIGSESAEIGSDRGSCD